MRTPVKYEGARTTSWRVRFRMGEGKGAKQTMETFSTEREALRFCRLLDDLGAQGALDQLYDERQRATAPLLDEYAAEYIASLPNISPGTRKRYTRIWEAQWSPRVGHEPVNRLSRLQVSRALVEMSEAGASDKTIRNRFGLLHGVMGSAVDEGYIDVSPCRNVKMPRRTQHLEQEMVLLSPLDFELLLAEVPDHWKPLVLTLAGTGMRWGEAVALNVGDVDLTTGTILITKAVKDGTRDIGPTKTRKSARTVKAGRYLAGALAPLVNGRQSTERLFVTPRGHEVAHRTFWSDIWRPSVHRAQRCADHADEACRCGTAHPERCKIHDAPDSPCGCPGTLAVAPRIHDLRHSFASWQLGRGVPLLDVSRSLGHSTVTTTADRYGHLMPDARERVAAAAESVFSGMSLAIER